MRDAGYVEPQHSLFVNITVDLLILTTSTEKSNLYKQAQRRLTLVFRSTYATFLLNFWQI